MSICITYEVLCLHRTSYHRGSEGSCRNLFLFFLQSVVLAMTANFEDDISDIEYDVVIVVRQRITIDVALVVQKDDDIDAPRPHAADHPQQGTRAH